ncbi:MAG TPA: carboxypeptidase-like regulatory domain-containing protein, partial [Edaphobacter sp.]|nr:carboxypeptidase-like regulatory domain-containing protein [Edaphobacter sp.]
MRFLLKLLCLLTVTALTAATTAVSQSGSGDLAGTVTDASGAAISSAKITLSSESAIGIIIQTGSTASGDFAVASLRPGSYTIRATAPGFSTLVRSGLSIRTGQRERINLTLQPGAADQVVNVTADASLLATESGALTTVV